MNIVIDHKPIRLSASDLLGTGGEGSVYKVGRSSAVKLYHQPDLHADKVRAMIANTTLPLNVVAPQTLVWNEREEQILGYVMERIGIGYDDVRELSKRKYRTAFKVTTRQVARLFQNAAATVQNIHDAGYIIGDFSDLNEVFQGETMLFLDVDAWQFGKYGCPVASEQFMSPRLYGVDLKKKPSFILDDDWYSFAVLLFKSLLGVHPYGGTHATVLDVKERAARRMTVFDQGIIYPSSVALPPDFLSDNLAHTFHEIFKEGKYGISLLSNLSDFVTNLVECPHCGATYPDQRQRCPVCSTVIPSISVSKGVTVRLFIQTPGKIVFSKMVNGSLVVISAEIDGAWLYKKEGRAILLGRYTAGMRYEKFGDLVVRVMPNDTEMMIENQIVETSTYRQKPMFRANGRYLFRLTAGSLLAGEMRNGHYVETILRSVMPEQTWFTVKQDSADKPTLCGFFQVFREQQWWVSFEGRWFDGLPLTSLAVDEVQMDVLVRFGTSDILIMRATQQGGVDYIHSATVDQTGTVTNTARVKGSDLPHGSVYAHGALLVPTDEGLVQVRNGVSKTFSQTKGVIEGGDTLYAYQDGLLVVKQDRVDFVKLN